MRAGFWVLVLRISQQLVSLGRTLIIARLLLPSDFGVLGIALLSQTLVELATSTGFSTALIQRKGEIRSYLDVAWTVEILRAGITGAALFLLSPWIARFFGAPAAEPIIQVVGVVYALRGFQNVSLVYLRKELDFRREFVFRFGQTLSNTLVAVPLAFILGSVWALAWGLLAEGLAALVLSYVILPHRPRLSLEFRKAWELFKYGRWIVLAEGLQLIALQADRFFVGKILGPAALGLYQLGNRLSLMVSSELAEGVTRVSLPTFAALQDELPRLRRALVRALELGLVVLLPTSAVLALLGREIVTVVLGDKWLGAVSVIQVLAFAGVARFITSTGVMPFQGLGMPRVGTQVTLLGLTAMVALLWPLIHWLGLPGAAAAVLLGNALVTPYLLHKWQSLIGVNLRDIAAALGPGAFLAGAVLVAISAVAAALDRRDAIYLVVASLSAGLAYLGGSVALWRGYRRGPFAIAQAARLVR